MHIEAAADSSKIPTAIYTDISSTGVRAAILEIMPCLGVQTTGTYQVLRS